MINGETVRCTSSDSSAFRCSEACNLSEVNSITKNIVLSESAGDTGLNRAKPARGRTTGIVSILTIAVAALGYLREATLASRFGLSASMDAYFAATFVPTLVYMVLVAGTLSPIFIPILVEHIAADNREELSRAIAAHTTHTQ